MRGHTLVGGTALLLVTAIVTAQQSIPSELLTMAETERAFAKTATVKGWRDAFLDFFADDAIAFASGVTSAKDGLRKQPSTPFTIFELVWEPRLGDVARSGELGWLTGPSTSINHSAKDSRPGHGCYLSIWRKQADGNWRVFIDVGANSPEPVTFAPGFNRIAFGDRYTGSDTKDVATQSLAHADRELNERITAVDASKAFAERLTPASRLHRPGTAPLTGGDTITRWLSDNASASTATSGSAEAAASGDFGYTYGSYEIKEPKPSKGAYVRLWNRDAAGRWWLMVDVAQPARQ
jgi:ketosteroid isomerase-like protein